MLKSQATTDGTPIAGLNPESNKRVLLGCDRCGAEYQVAYKSYVCKQREYRRHGETYCRSCSNIVSRGKRRLGPSKRSKAIGSKNANFKGGRFVASDGHVMTRIGVGQYVREDLVIMGNVIGRAVDMSAGERVLHIDFNKANNARENLVLLPSVAAYRSAKQSLETAALQLLRLGLLKYDHSSNSYVPALDHHGDS